MKTEKITRWDTPRKGFTKTMAISEEKAKKRSSKGFTKRCHGKNISDKISFS